MKSNQALQMQTRRKTLQQSALVAGLMATVGLFPEYAFALNKGAFEAKNLHDVFKALGAGAPVASKDVLIGGPDMAENGALVPLTASCSLPGVKQMLFLVEKNPSSLIALFNMTESVEASFSIRTKMKQTCDVFAVAVMADGRALFAKKEVRVTMSGCGA